jgi:hypothetical protein
MSEAPPPPPPPPPPAQDAPNDVLYLPHENLPDETKRSDLLPVPEPVLEEHMADNRHDVDRILLWMPMLPMPVFTPRLAMLLTGKPSWPTSDSMALLHLYVVVLRVFSADPRMRSGSDPPAPEGATSREDILKEHTEEALQLANEATARLRALGAQRESVPDAYRAALQHMHEMTVQLLHRYERSIMRLLDESALVPCLPAWAHVALITPPTAPSAAPGHRDLPRLLAKQRQALIKKREGKMRRQGQPVPAVPADVRMVPASAAGLPTAAQLFSHAHFLDFCA